MRLKVENKIGILINWEREIDMYNQLISSIDSNRFVLIVNDIKTIELERKNNTQNIINELKKKNFNFILFSQIYKKIKYKVLISTALSYPRKITLVSVLKFFYGKTIGLFIQATKTNKILYKIFKKNLTAGGSHAKIYTEWFPEKKIGIKTVLFPKGFDIRLKHFPNSKFEKIFDIFLCHGILDQELIKKKFKNPTTYIIGYPRYDNLESQEITREKIFREFIMPMQKKLIFWCPTHIEEKKEIFENINLWKQVISLLSKDYNVLIRPHPKSLALNRKLSENLIKLGFFVDKKTNRKMGNIYNSSDLILADYGGSVLSSVYLEKPLVLLNLPKNFEFLKKLIPTESLDVKVREEIDSFNIESIDEMNFKQEIDKIISSNNVDKIKKIKNRYFGNGINNLNIKNLAKKLEIILKN